MSYRRRIKGVVTRLHNKLRRVYKLVVHGCEVALEPAPSNLDEPLRLRFRPDRFARYGLREARARLGVPASVIRPLSPDAVPSGDRPRVIHLIESIIVGGSQKLVFDIVRGLGSRYDMEIVTRAIHGRIHFGNLPIRIATDNAALERLFAERRPAFVHLHYWGPSTWLDLAMEVLQSICPGVQVIENVNTPVQAWIHPAASHFVYVSEYARSLQQTPTEPSCVIYPGVDTDEYQPPAALCPEETVGLVYRLENDKLAPETIEVLIALVRRRPRARIVLIGTGSNFSRYVARTRAAGVRANFDFMGLVPFHALPAIYDGFALFCAPVHTESFGVVVPYALAKNIPVCGYRVGALPEILGSEETLADSPDELATLAAGLLADRSRLVQLGQAGRARVLENFSLTTMLNAYRELYAQLLVSG